MIWGSRRADHDLVHPDKKTVTAGHAHRGLRPNQHRENDEGEQFFAPAIARRSMI
jgi:hypothetical protein